jgi:DNA-binding transcriptional MocR family regulator
MRLPSERALADALGLSRVTVSSAYATLRADGWIETVRGAGSPARLPAGLDARIDAGAPAEEGGAIDLARAAPMAPLPAYLAALERATERLGTHAQHPGAVRLPDLRGAIAERYTRAGLPTAPEQVLVTTGAGAALLLVARYVLAPAARVLVESPTWPGALELMRAARLRLIGWPMANGWDPELFDALLREVRPAGAYLVLDFHNPTGALATAREREAISRSVARTGTLLVVDETMRDLDLRGPGAVSVPIAPEGPQTLHVGSLAKVVWAGLGVGWLRGPAARIEELAATPEGYYLTPPVLQQTDRARAARRA